MLILRTDLSSHIAALQLTATSDAERIAYAAVLLSFGPRPHLNEYEFCGRLVSLAAKNRRPDYHRALALVATAFNLDEYSLPELRRPLLEVVRE